MSNQHPCLTTVVRRHNIDLDTVPHPQPKVKPPEMIPIAGLFLSEVSHRSDRNHNLSNQRVAQYSRHPKQFSKPHSSPNITFEGPKLPSATVRELSNKNTIVVSSYSKADNWCYPQQHKGVLAVKSRMHQIDAVRHKLDEAFDLKGSILVTRFLDAWPDKKTWIETTLSDAHCILRDIDERQYVADSRERHLKHFKSLQMNTSKMQRKLEVCHHNITGAIHIMQTIAICASPPKDFGDAVFQAPILPWDPSKSTDERVVAGRYPKSGRKKTNTSERIATDFTPGLANSNELRAPLIPHKPSRLAVRFPEGDRSLPVELPGDSPVELMCGSLRQESPAISKSFHAGTLPTRSTGARRSRALQNHLNSEQMTTAITGSSREQIEPSSSDADEAKSSTTPDRFTATVSTMLATAKFYRGQAMNVSSNNDKRQSLPSQLPFVQSQTSLIDDLVGWVDQCGIEDTILTLHSPETKSNISPIFGDSTSSSSLRSSTSPSTYHPWPISEEIITQESRISLAKAFESNSISTHMDVQSLGLPQEVKHNTDSFRSQSSSTSPDTSEDDQNDSSVCSNIVHEGYYTQLENGRQAGAVKDRTVALSDPAHGGNSTSSERAQKIVASRTSISSCRSLPASFCTSCHTWEPITISQRPATAPNHETNVATSLSQCKPSIKRSSNTENLSATLAEQETPPELRQSPTDTCKRTASHLAPELSMLLTSILPDPSPSQSTPLTALAKRRAAHTRRMQLYLYSP